jgi:hypothetical protein
MVKLLDSIEQRLDTTHRALSIIAVLDEAKVPAPVRKRILAALKRRGVMPTAAELVE